MSLGDYRTALVTGASSGVGAATARALRERGLEVHAVARGRDRLEPLAREIGAVAHVLDLRDSAAIHQAFGALEIDILVNNAGVGLGYEGGFLTLSPDEIDAQLETNLSAALHATRAVASGMARRRRGHVVNVTSISALYPIKFATYAAGKGGLHLFSQNLRIELQGTGVRVTEVAPGRTRTSFFDAAMPDVATREAFLSGFEILRPEDVADAILYALDAPWRVNVGLIELTPTEQFVGGMTVVPVPDRG
jgi:NADP-dependent 3-hydroxy acid dehydrogenase YdfG